MTKKEKKRKKKKKEGGIKIRTNFGHERSHLAPENPKLWSSRGLF